MCVVVDTIALSKWQQGCKMSEVMTKVEGELGKTLRGDDDIAEFIWRLIIEHGEIEIKVCCCKSGLHIWLVSTLNLHSTYFNITLFESNDVNTEYSGYP